MKIQKERVPEAKKQIHTSRSHLLQRKTIVIKKKMNFMMQIVDQKRNQSKTDLNWDDDLRKHHLM